MHNGKSIFLIKKILHSVAVVILTSFYSYGTESIALLRSNDNIKYYPYYCYSQNIIQSHVKEYLLSELLINPCTFDDDTTKLNKQSPEETKNLHITAKEITLENLLQGYLLKLENSKKDGENNITYIPIDLIDTTWFRQLCYLRTVSKKMLTVINKAVENLNLYCAYGVFQEITLPTIHLEAENLYTISFFSKVMSQKPASPNKNQNINTISLPSQPQINYDDNLRIEITNTYSVYTANKKYEVVTKDTEYLSSGDNRIGYIDLLTELDNLIDEEEKIKLLVKKLDIGLRVYNAQLWFLLLGYKQYENGSGGDCVFDIPYYQNYFTIKHFINRPPAITIQIKDPHTYFSKAFFKLGVMETYFDKITNTDLLNLINLLNNDQAPLIMQKNQPANLEPSPSNTLPKPHTRILKSIVNALEFAFVHFPVCTYIIIWHINNVLIFLILAKIFK